MKKRLLATLLTLCLLFSLLPVGASATVSAADVDTTNNVVTLNAATSAGTLDEVLSGLTGSTKTLDLNGQTLTLSGTTTLGTDNNPVYVTIKNTSTSSAGQVILTTTGNGFEVTNGSSLTITGVKKQVTMLADSGTAIVVKGEDSALEIYNVFLRAKVNCVATDNSNAANNGVSIDLKNSTLAAFKNGYNGTGDASTNTTCAVLMEVPGDLSITSCRIYSGKQDVVVRAGTATISKSSLYLYGIEGGYFKSALAYSGTLESATWASTGADDSHDLPAAALLVGNYSSTELSETTSHGDAQVTVSGTVIQGTDTIPAIYVDGNPIDKSSVTVADTNNDANNMSAITGVVKKGKTPSDNTNVSITLKSGGYSSATENDLAAFIPSDVKYETNEAKTSTDIGTIVKIGDKEYATLQSAIDAVQDGETITLMGNLNLAKRGHASAVVNNGKTFTINLATYTLTGTACKDTYLVDSGWYAILLRHGNVTVTNGTVYGYHAGVWVCGSDEDVANYSVLNIADDATISGDYWGIRYSGAKYVSEIGYGGVINVEGTVEGCVFFSGNLGNSTEAAVAMKDAKNLNTLNVKRGAKMTAGQPIILSSWAIVNVYDGATIEGDSEAIAMKDGILNVYGGKLIAHGAKVDPVAANGNGSELSGAAISITSTYNNKDDNTKFKYSVDDHTADSSIDNTWRTTNGYARTEIIVNIEGGEIKSDNNAAVYVGHSVKSGKTLPFYSGVTLNISGGTFTGGDGSAVYVAEKITGANWNSGAYATYSTGDSSYFDNADHYPTDFITSGTFNSDVSEYVQKAGAYVAVDNDDGTWTVKEVPVATIGSGISTQQFDSLQEAVEAAGTASTEITLTADVAEAISVDAGQNVIINLNKHTLTTTKPSGEPAVTEGITNAGTLSIKNGTIKSDDALATVIKNTGDLTLTDVAVNLTGNTAALVPIDNQGKLTLEGSTTVPNGKTGDDTGTPVAIQNTPIADPGSSLTVAAGTNVDVGNILIAKTNNNYKFALNIASGKFGTITTTTGDTTDTITGHITGGTYDNNIADYVEPTGAYVSTQLEGGKYGITTNVVATIGNGDDLQQFDSVKEAVDAANAVSDGNTTTTINVLQDTEANFTIDSGKKVVIDLGTNTLTLKKSGTNTVGITNNGELTIKGKVTNAADVTTLIENKGTLTLEDATVTPTGESATLTIDNQGTLTLAGTTDVKNAKADESVLEGKQIAISNSGTSIVNVASTETGVTVGNILLDQSSAVSISLNIAEGTFGSIETKGANGTITGNITGGTFDNDVDAYVQKGTGGVNAYKSVENGNGTYTVKVDAVASMDGSTYKTLAAAIAAASNNTREITLLESVNISEAVTISTGTITINLDNNTLTLTNSLSVESGGTLTLKNGKVEGNVDNLIQNSGTLTLDDVTVTPGDNTNITIDNFGALTLAGNTSVPNGKKETGYAISNHTAATDGSSLTVGAETTVDVGNILIAKTNNDYKFTLNIASGTFGTITPTGSTTDTITGSITGGTFTDNVSGYCASGYAAVASSEGGYEVTKATDVKLQTTTVESEIVVVDDKRTYGESFTSYTEQQNAKYVAENVKVDLTNNEQNENIKLVSDGTQKAEEAAALEKLAKNGTLTIQEDGTVTVSDGSSGGEKTATVTLIRETYLDVKTESINTSNSTVTVEITQKYDLYAAILADGETAAIATGKVQIAEGKTADTTDSTVAVSIKVPQNIVLDKNPDKAYITHEHTDGNGGTTTNYYTAKYNSTEQTVTFENPDGFSTFTVSFTNPRAATGAKTESTTNPTLYADGTDSTLDLREVLVPTPSDALVENTVWTSSNEDIATVENGVVTGHAVGNVTITANFDGYTTSIDLEVVNHITKVSLNKTTLTLAPNETQTLTPTFTPATNIGDTSVTWESSNPKVAKVENGVITALKDGETTITVKTKDGNKTATCQVTVKYLVSSVSIGNNFGLKIGDEKTLSATVLPAGAKQTVTWTSSDPTVATVDQTGKITALATGKTTITATSTDDSSKSDYCVVTVSDVEVTNVGWKTTLQQPMEVGQTGKLVPLIVPENATEDVSWKSSNPDVATVDQEGNVTAIGAGTAVITVTAGTKTADFTVTVSAPPADNNGQGDGSGEGNTGDNSGTTTPPEDGSGTTTPPDDNQNQGGNTGEDNTGEDNIGEGSGTTTPPDNSGTTTPPDDNQNQGGTVTPPVDDNKGEDNKNEAETPEETPTITFTDLTQDWYQDAVVWAVKKGVTTGITATTFAPNKDCTRAMVVTFLWRAAGSPEPKSTTTVFRDVDVNEYYAKAVAWAVENGITNGTSATAFSPNATCTRAQVATFLWRAANKPQPQSATTTFTDLKAGEYYETAVIWGAETGIIKGMSTTAFKPNDTCTRAQVVTFLYRAQ